MTTILGMVITCINGIISLVGKALGLIFILLPDSPFSVIDNSPIIEFIGYINYLIPVAEIIGIMTLWCSAVALYYIVSIALRW